MSVLPPGTVRHFVGLLGVTPQSDPAAYDRLSRELDGWWEAGGSCRSFVAVHQVPRPMSGRDAYRRLVAKLPCP